MADPLCPDLLCPDPPAADPAALAAIHAAAFTVPPPWDAAAIAALLARPGCFAITRPGGFALGQVVLDEAELLTIAVLPTLRGQGIGRRLLADFMARAAALGARRGFLEVACDNAVAHGLYQAAGWRDCGRRRGYYRPAGGAAVDAVVMECGLDPTSGDTGGDTGGKGR